MSLLDRQLVRFGRLLRRWRRQYGQVMDQRLCISILNIGRPDDILVRRGLNACDPDVGMAYRMTSRICLYPAA